MKVTFIKWLDASGSDQNIWTKDEELNELLVQVQTAGLIMSEDDERITVVGSKTSGAFMGDITIPKIGITFRKDFEVAE